jgi:hypothetical protein
MYNRLQWTGGKADVVLKILTLEFKKRTSPGTNLWLYQINRVGESESIIRTLVSQNYFNSFTCSLDGKKLVSGFKADTLKL